MTPIPPALASVAKRSETAIVGEILAFLRTVRGVVAWRNNVGAVTTRSANGKARHVRFGFRGMADIVGWRQLGHAKECLCGHGQVHHGGDGCWATVTTARACMCPAWRPGPVAQVVCIEVKRPGQRPTPEQAAFLDLVRKSGGLAIVATSVEDVVAALERRT